MITYAQLAQNWIGLYLDWLLLGRPDEAHCTSDALIRCRLDSVTLDPM